MPVFDQLTCDVRTVLVPIFANSLLSYFFFNDTATTETYTLSLHDALPISPAWDRPPSRRRSPRLPRRSRSRPDQPGHRRRRLGYLGVRLRATGLDRLAHAVSKVPIQQADSHLLQRAGGRGYLGQDVDAVAVLVDHALQPTHLALDPTQPALVLLALVAVPVGRR